jgi:hypothetical protein
MNNARTAASIAREIATTYRATYSTISPSTTPAQIHLGYRLDKTAAELAKIARAA